MTTCHMSAFAVAIGCKADIGYCGAHVRLSPKAADMGEFAGRLSTVSVVRKPG